MGDRDAETMYSTSDQTLENQNEEELQSLHGKIKALRSVSSIVALVLSPTAPVQVHYLL